MKDLGRLRSGARLAVMAVTLVLTATPMTAQAAARSVDAGSGDGVFRWDVTALDTSGIPLVSALVQAKPTSESQAQAISDALEFARSHPDDVGYPWIDPASGQLVLSAATPAGSALLADSSASLKTASSIRDVSFSFGKLEAIKDEVTTLHEAGMPDASLIYMTGPDPKTNRITIVVSAPSAKLFGALASRFGTQAIELRIDASMLGAQPGFDRQHDSYPFWGGASIQSAACSDGFAWTAGTTGNAMLTAAHCFSSGGSAKIGDYSNAGSVRSGSEENWDPAHGTQYYTGQSTYRGDVALIRLNSPYTSSPHIYRGGVNSSTSSPVLSRYSRFAAAGDVVYVSGRNTGDTGPYTVDLTGWNFLYDPPSDEWAKNMSSAARGTIDTCAGHGDSGGAVFSTVSGGVKAAGIFSGFLVCRIYFTPIYDTYLALPGDIYHT